MTLLLLRNNLVFFSALVAWRRPIRSNANNKHKQNTKKSSVVQVEVEAGQHFSVSIQVCHNV